MSLLSFQRRSSILFLLVSSLLASSLNAQTFQRKKARRLHDPAPKALLIMLPTFEGRARYLSARGDSQHLALLRKDIEGLWRSMRTDFGKYFSYCPVYFFVDTNAEAILKQQFAGVLLDSSLHPASGHALNTDTTYLIGAYSVRTRDADELILEKDGASTLHVFNGDTEASSARLVLHNYQMKQLERPRPREPINRKGMYTRAEVNSIYSPFTRSRLRFRSRHFDIRYNAVAGVASIVLRHFYGPYPY